MTDSTDFRHLSEVPHSELIALMNNPKVRQHMPLSNGDFNQEHCDEFLAAKASIWTQHGYGPWAFYKDERFIGWGGFQPEGDYADLALVLHPDAWGQGISLYKTLLQKAFSEMDLQVISILLPPSRTRIKALAALGFERHGSVNINGETFYRYLLNAAASPSYQG